VEQRLLMLTPPH